VAHGDSVEDARSKLGAGLETLGVSADDRAAMVAALAQVLGLERDDARMRHLEPEQLKRQIFLATRALMERRLAAGQRDLAHRHTDTLRALDVNLPGIRKGCTER